MKAIICGGRDHPDFREDAEIKYLDHLHNLYQIRCVIEGEAKGADHQGKLWAISRKIPVIPITAQWDTYAKAAGHKRNQLMMKILLSLCIETEDTPAVIAFKGGTGTNNMINLADNNHVDVYIFMEQLCKEVGII